MVILQHPTMFGDQRSAFVMTKVTQAIGRILGKPFCKPSCLSVQGFVKRRLEEAAVSQRDLQRVFNMLAFFIEHHNQRRQELPLTVPIAHEAVVHRSLLLSIALVYYFRLSSQLRRDFRNEIGALDAMSRQQQDDQVPCYDVAEVVEYELELYIKAAELPPGIAANQALRENFYCIAVCMQTKTPLIIVGGPGPHPKLAMHHTALHLDSFLLVWIINMHSSTQLNSQHNVRCPHGLIWNALTTGVIVVWHWQDVGVSLLAVQEAELCC